MLKTLAPLVKPPGLPVKLGAKRITASSTVMLGHLLTTLLAQWLHARAMNSAMV